MKINQSIMLHAAKSFIRFSMQLSKKVVQYQYMRKDEEEIENKCVIDSMENKYVKINK